MMLIDVVAEVILQVKLEEIVGVAGKLSDAESMMSLKHFLNRPVQIISSVK